MQLLLAVLALGAVAVAQGPNFPPTGNNFPFNPRPFSGGFNPNCPDSHPNGYGPGIGPTDCGQLVRDCGYSGFGQTCTTNYAYIVNCYNGNRFGGYQWCGVGARCNAAVDGSGARCVDNNFGEE